MHKLTENTKKRWPRHKVKIPVSIKCPDSSGSDPSWYIGVTEDISVDGISIISRSLPALKPGTMVSILCFPESGNHLFQISEPEPVSMTGRVVWQDMERHTTGIEIVS